jgi:hypothetical protein
MPDYPREVPKWDIYRCAVCYGEVAKDGGRGHHIGGGIYILTHWNHYRYFFHAKGEYLDEALQNARVQYLEDCYYNWII